MPRSGGGVVRRAVWWALVVVLVAGLGRTAWYATGSGSEAARVSGQLRWLGSELDHHDAAGRMQGLFPEGAFFTTVLDGLARTATAQGASGPERTAALEVARRRLADLRSRDLLATFPATAELPHGVFAEAWTLLLEADVAGLDGTPAERDAMRARATRLRDALDRSAGGFLQAYPGQAWPVDTVVAAAALARADRVEPVPGTAGTLRRWVARVELHRDPVTRLLPHRVAPDGTGLEGPRGSSSALAQVFWPDADPEAAAADYPRFVATFVTRVVGAIGVREYPRGTPGGGDVDSGPLVAGVSLSATAVALAAARRAGDERLARDLLAQAEVAGLPVQAAGQRRYAAGVLPVGDAFLLWARTRPVGEGTPAVTAPRPLWVLWSLPWVLGLLLLVAVPVLRHRRRRGASGSGRDGFGAVDGRR
ncbi:hypothetical protein [Phycicoccus flavus]|uniref:hypothetical protein n=1 Tax=Phycicoccus flavus TaxID=2502783 RepID=UPI000FEBBE20|nr:hypothetical protein [Phycicoccus flavus]NHA67520.1 hypothetical protein [Phycicoccus flavus]